MNERELLYELFIPALRYYLPRRSACAMTFPSFCKRAWSDLTELDREIALRDIKVSLRDRLVGDSAEPHWRRFVKWAEQGGDDG